MIGQLDDVCKSHLIVDLFSIEYLDILDCLINQDILLKIDQQKYPFEAWPETLLNRAVIDSKTELMQFLLNKGAVITDITVSYLQGSNYNTVSVLTWNIDISDSDYAVARLVLTILDNEYYDLLDILISRGLDLNKYNFEFDVEISYDYNDSRVRESS